MLKYVLQRLRGNPVFETIPTLQAYEIWANTYPPRAHNPLMQVEEASVMKLCPPLRGKVVLDLACGTGRYSGIAQTAEAAYVVGFDISSAMLRANHFPLKALATSDYIPLVSESVDVILCGLALGHLSSIQLSVAEIGRVLKPDGYAIISDFHPYNVFSGKQRTFRSPKGKIYSVEHYAHLYADYFKAAVNAGLTITDVLEPALDHHNKGDVERVNSKGETPIVIVYQLRKAI